MAESADVWTPLGVLIDSAPTEPLTKTGNPIFDPRFPRWYRGAVHVTVIDGKETLPRPGYVLLGMELEGEIGLYNGEAGQDYLGRAHCWAQTPDDARRLYRWLKQTVQGVTLTVAGYGPLSLILGKSGPTADEDGNGWQVEATMRGEFIEATA